MTPPLITEAARHFQAGEGAEAEGCCRAILAADPRHFDALHLTGVLCLRRRALAEAVGYLRRAEQVRPGVAQVHTNLGHAYLGLALHDEAERWYRRALRPRNDPALLNDLASALAGAGRHRAAEATFREALALAPDYPPVRYNLARCLAAQDRHAEAAILFQGVLDGLGVDPKRREVTSAGLATSLGALGHYDQALAVCRALLARCPQSASGAWDESLALLSLGRYAEGWARYEARWRVAAHDPPHPRGAVLDIAAVAGRSVLVVAEQGRGDVLQFARFVPMLAAVGAQVTLQVYPDLVPVLQAMPGIRVISLQHAEPATDFVTHLLSLPLAFGTTGQSIPASVPYLSAPPERLAFWRTRLGERRGRRIGLAWRGLQHIPQRSVPVAALAPLLEVGGVMFHALQNEITPSDRDWLDRHGVAAHDTALRDFGDTAALISLLDLVITIDTAVAHLAGGLGAPVWLMLARNADWRWMTGRDDSPWYPTARLFRQQLASEWPGVVARIAAALPGAGVG